RWRPTARNPLSAPKSMACDDGRLPTRGPTYWEERILASRSCVPLACVAARRGLVSVPDGTHPLGDPCHLLLDLAMARTALGFGNRLCRLRGRGHLGCAGTTHVCGLDRAVPRGRRVVVVDLSVERSSMATGSSRDAASAHRRRPRAPYRCPRFQI